MANRIPRTSLVVRISFLLVFVFLFISVINIQILLKDKRDQLAELQNEAVELQDDIDELKLRISTPITEEYIERVVRDMGYRKPNEILFYNNIAS